MEQNCWTSTTSHSPQRTEFVQGGYRRTGNRTGIVMGSKRKTSPTLTQPQIQPQAPLLPQQQQQQQPQQAFIHSPPMHSQTPPQGCPIFVYSPPPLAQQQQQPPQGQFLIQVAKPTATSQQQQQQQGASGNGPAAAQNKNFFLPTLLPVFKPSIDFSSATTQSPANPQIPTKGVCNVTFTNPNAQKTQSMPLPQTRTQSPTMTVKTSPLPLPSPPSLQERLPLPQKPLAKTSTPKTCTNSKAQENAKECSQSVPKNNNDVTSKAPNSPTISKSCYGSTANSGNERGMKMKLPPPPPPSSSPTTSPPPPSSSPTLQQQQQQKTKKAGVAAGIIVPSTSPTSVTTEKADNNNNRRSIVTKSIEWYQVSVSVLQTRGVACKNPFIVGKVDDMVGYRSKTLKNVVGDPHWENEAFIVGCYRDCEYNGSAITLEVFDQDKQAPEPRRLGVCRVPVARKKELSKIGASEWLPLREDEGDNGGAPLGEICVKVMASPAPRVVFESPLLRKQGLLKFRPVHVVLFEPSLLAIYENATYTNELERVNISEVTSAELRYNEKRITLKLDMGDSGSSSDNSNSSDSSSSSSSSNGNGNGNGGSNSGDPGLLSGLWSKTIDYVFSGGKPYIRNWVKVLRKFCVRAVEDEMRFPIIANALATVAVAANAGSDPNLQQQQQQQQQQHKLQQGPSGATATTVSDGEASAYFGVTLEKLSKCGLCNSDGVPVFVQTLIDTIAARGLRTEGIFRVSGPVMEVSAARRRLDAGGLAGFLRPDEPVHVVSGLLKMFFRELPEPIFTFELYQRFINSVLVVDIEESKREMKAVMAEAPRENMAVLKALVRLLCRVCENCAVNKMTSANLSIIFAPTLVWSDTM